VDEILLNGEERDRLQVLQAAKKGQIRQSQAAAELRLSRRWVKKLIQRLRKQGDRGVLHGLKGRRSNRCIAREKEHEAVQLIREHYRDYGPTQAACWSRHRILVFGRLGDFAGTLTKGAHIEVEGALRSREQTLKLKGSSKKNPETKNVRSWFIRAESIRKLDRAETSSEEAEDVPF
jgi:transposase